MVGSDELTLGGEVSLADVQAGLLRFVPAPDDHGERLDLSFEWLDGNWNPVADGTVHGTVTPVDDAAAFADAGGQGVLWLAQHGGDEWYARAQQLPDGSLVLVGTADGGSGGDPLDMGQNLGSAFGKILRIDPLGNNSANGKYGIPRDNPFVNDNNPQTLGEIYAYGVRNPQRFGWDPKNGNMFLAEIGQNIVEEISLVPRGGNLGWNEWEASFRFVSRTEIKLNERRADPKVTYPVVEYDHKDPLLGGNVATTGVIVYRSTAIPQLANLVIFGDNPSGEVFYFNADRLPNGGQDAIRRILFNSGGAAKTLLQLIKEKAPSATRADLRFGTGPNDRVFLLNKQDGVIREIIR